MQKTCGLRISSLIYPRILAKEHTVIFITCRLSRKPKPITYSSSQIQLVIRPKACRPIGVRTPEEWIGMPLWEIERSWFGNIDLGKHGLKD